MEIVLIGPGSQERILDSYIFPHTLQTMHFTIVAIETQISVTLNGTEIMRAQADQYTDVGGVFLEVCRATATFSNIEIAPPVSFDHQAILTKRNCQRVMPDKPGTPPQFFVYKGKFHHLWPEAAELLNELRIRPKFLEPEEEPIIQELEGAPIGSRAEMEDILKEFCPELLPTTRQSGKPMAIPQQPPSAERPVPAIAVPPAIRQLAALIHARREAGDQPYI